jgi:hypothetical protein
MKDWLKPFQKSKTTECFINDAIKIHKDKYDYSLVQYVNARTKIKIICKDHGIFEQVPNSHLVGNGCYYCGKLSLAKKQTITQENFIEKCNKVHNNKYDYSSVNYQNCKVKIKIICPEHGIFEQTPDHHSRGIGCPTCSKYYGSF